MKRGGNKTRTKCYERDDDVHPVLLEERLLLGRLQRLAVRRKRRRRLQLGSTLVHNVDITKKRSSAKERAERDAPRRRDTPRRSERQQTSWKNEKNMSETGRDARN